MREGELLVAAGRALGLPSERLAVEGAVARLALRWLRVAVQEATGRVAWRSWVIAAAVGVCVCVACVLRWC